MGEKKATMILKNCQLVNVYSREIIPKTQIAILKDRIAYVGSDATQSVGPKTTVIDLKEKYVTPGFADSHIHIDQYILPSELAKKSLLCGVTSIFSDPIDIVSVCGYKGFQEFVRQSEELFLRIFHLVPGGLPVDRKFSHGKTLSLHQEKSALKLDNVLGLGEVFSWTKVTTRDAKTMKSLSSMLKDGCIINGHTAGASDKKLNAYVSSGILSCHEPINFDQVLERLRLGMWIMIREGSIRRDLRDIITQVKSHNTYIDRLMFCSDGINPLDIEYYGHIDHCVREAINNDINPIDAFTIASKNCFDYYNMEKDLGGIAPGKLADILVFDDLITIKPRRVFVGGELVASNGSIVSKIQKKLIPSWIKKTVKLGKKFLKNDFYIKSKLPTVSANSINLSTEIITKLDLVELKTKDGNVLPSFDKDIWKVAAFDRISGSNKRAIGFLNNFGANVGAFASTWSYHENDLIVIGSNENDMAYAVNHLIKTQGGIVIVKNCKILVSIPLQFGGIISTNSFEKVNLGFKELNSTLIDAGSKFKRPHLIPLFLPFLALPSVRITHSGIIDVKRGSFVSPIN